MNYLENLRTFVAVVDLGTLTQAADQLYIAKSAVSRRMAELEEHLGVQLFHRTTRAMTLTPEGQQFYERSRGILDAVFEAENEVKSAKQHLKGKFKITAPLTFGLEHLSPLLNAFLCEHPDLELDLDFSDRQVDVIEEGFDLALRIGHLEDSNLKAKVLSPIRRVLCASPDYLARHGEPHTIEQLSTHPLLHYTLAPLRHTLFYRDEQGNNSPIPMPIRLAANNGSFLMQAAIAGQGITFLPTFIVYKALEAGQLKIVLPDHAWEQAQLYALYPPTRHLAQRVRRLIDFLQQQCTSEPYWDQCLKQQT
ncbi:MAG: LysR family transcriptional regulator [Thiofilum sp.]|uniref:LysR family transcriptional regulator n=1 Tax=Thiofilum sp. TaxID=2212733 RepID=UPI0025F5D452|nr:LysR family transcriptional regulator [Thiofilum sp.]MBK8454884.1 LysR family transcriptional regulator [Thiofilum sp.]